MYLGFVSPETEKRLILAVLNAWKKDATRDEGPWHITDAGWYVYATHKDPEIRAAAINHPYYACPSRHLQRRREEFKLNVVVYS
jgi:hypothetical protein